MRSNKLCCVGLLGATVVAQLLVIALSIWDGVSLWAPHWARPLLLVTTVTGAGLLALSIALSVALKQWRRSSLMFSMTFVAVLVLASWSASRHAALGRQWFVQQQMPSYDTAVQRIIGVGELSQQWHLLKRVEGYAGRVWGISNQDGSVTIMFQGRDGSPRAGYLYHSGSTLTTNPVLPKAYIGYITNGWYEY
jgi:hypothetical protein